MSEGIAPLPNGMAISVVAEQGPRSDRDPRQPRGEQSRDTGPCAARSPTHLPSFLNQQGDLRADFDCKFARALTY